MKARTLLQTAVAAALALSVAACTAQPTETETGTAPLVGGAAAQFAAENYTTPLADVCPATVSLQWNWWPQASHGWAYQLIGEGGTVDPETYAYTGPLGSTGVNLELRPGGPATGGQLPLAQLYADDSLLLGITITEDSVGNSEEFPTVSVFATENKSGLVFFWGNEDWDFKNLTDIKESGETLLAFEGSPYLGVLESLGLLDPNQVDASYKGDPARFIVEEGNVLQQGIVTSEVYKYEHDIPQWNKPVKYVSVGDEYRAYHSQVSIRADKLEENRACLEKLVPLFQQSAVDYAHSPELTNETLLSVVGELEGTGWTLSKGIVDWASAKAVAEGVVANGSDGVFGSFDLDRIDEFIAEVGPVLRKTGKNVPDDLKSTDFVTNEFLDPTIKL